MNIENILTLSVSGLFALVGLAIQFVNYRRRLKMDSTYFHVLGVSEDTSVFLLRLSFVNNASIGRVVYDIVPKDKPANIILDKARYTLDLNHRNVIYQLPMSEVMTLPISEVLLPPLHIPPHQSLNIWFGMEMKVTPKGVEIYEKEEQLRENMRQKKSAEQIGRALSPSVEMKHKLDLLETKIQLKAISIEKKELCFCEKMILPFRIDSCTTFEPPPEKFKFGFSIPDFVFEPNIFFLLLFILILILVVINLRY
jgi:hypothetical protein